jgi:hypothetical protein
MPSLRPLAAAALVLAFATAGAARADTYVVSPRASDATKAAVAAGRPPEHGYPEIETVDWNAPSTVHPGTHITATVVTSSNVHYVEGRVKYWNVALEETAPGRFQLNYRIPLLPPTAIGHWNVEVIARSVDGVETKRSFPVTYSYF